MNDPTTGSQGPQAPPTETALRDLVDHIPATIVVLADRPTVSIVYASAQIERLTGYSVKEWIDDPDLWTRSIHPADREPFADAWAAAVSHSTPFWHEFRLISREGAVVRVRATAEPLIDDDGGSCHGKASPTTSPTAPRQRTR